MQSGDYSQRKRRKLSMGGKAEETVFCPVVGDVVELLLKRTSRLLLAPSTMRRNCQLLCSLGSPQALVADSAAVEFTSKESLGQVVPSFGLSKMEEQVWILGRCRIRTSFGFLSYNLFTLRRGLGCLRYSYHAKDLRPTHLETTLLRFSLSSR
jgi:hypothetical protein